MVRHKLQIIAPIRSTKIYKYNPLIMGRVNMKNLTDYDFRLWNFLFSRLQSEVRQAESFYFQSYTLSIPLKDIKQALYGGKYADRWRETLGKSITRLVNTCIKLKDFKLPVLETAQMIKACTETKNCRQADFPLILESYIFKNHIEISFSQAFVYFAWLKRDYTHIAESTIALKSKYAQRLAELIEYHLSVYKSRAYNTKELFIETAILNEALGLDSKKSLSVNLNLINFKKTIIPQLKKLYPKIEISTHKTYITIKGLECNI